MKRLIIVGLLILFGVILVSCDSTKPQDYGKLIGIVTNENNEPIEGAKIVLNYHLEKIERTNNNASLDFFDSETTKIWITKYGQTDTLVVDYFTAGQHNYSWDGRDDNGIRVINDAYDVHIESPTISKITTILLLNDYYSAIGDEVNDCEAMAITNHEGKYELPVKDLLMFKYTDSFEEISANGSSTGNMLHVSNYAQVWAIHPDYAPVFIDSIYVNYDNKIKVDLNLND